MIDKSTVVPGHMSEEINKILKDMKGDDPARFATPKGFPVSRTDDEREMAKDSGMIDFKRYQELERESVKHQRDAQMFKSNYEVTLMKVEELSKELKKLKQDNEDLYDDNEYLKFLLSSKE